ncbi:DgyrCDS12405 [Dimorphilus gyrociliatus]|uniref:DgyrCDS12405 n=1 Tax=Dimorphilus gyrociliatus TaxID=2664684 RepID=A0A7I8W6C0_9ANNE|nr:DgyrCDS12405 [Dimorphilus gyrociliatus]
MDSLNPSAEISQYENDLQLAAELGKSLLERNEILEKQLEEYAEINYQQEQELKNYSKQVQLLKEFNESRLKVYEEVEKQNNELDQRSHHFQSENERLREKINWQNERIEALERHSDELQKNIDDFKADISKRSAEKEQKRNLHKRRTLSVPSLRRKPLPETGFAPPPSVEEVRDTAIVTALKTTVKNLKHDLKLEYKRSSVMEQQISELSTRVEQLNIDLESAKAKNSICIRDNSGILEDDSYEQGSNELVQITLNDDEKSLFGELKEMAAFRSSKDAATQTIPLRKPTNLDRPKSLQFLTPKNPVEGRFEISPNAAEYKQLFREIHDNIKKALSFDEAID